MQAVSHSPTFAKKVGIPQSVGSDFEQADKGRKFAKGGETMATKNNPGFMAMIAKKKGGESESLAKHASKPASKAHAGLKAGGPAKKMASGGFTRAADGVATKGKTKAKQVKMAMGGSCK